jgi:hypothetical protein
MPNVWGKTHKRRTKEQEQTVVHVPEEIRQDTRLIFYRLNGRLRSIPAIRDFFPSTRPSAYPPGRPPGRSSHTPSQLHYPLNHLTAIVTGGQLPSVLRLYCDSPWLKVSVSVALAALYKIGFCYYDPS